LNFLSTRGGDHTRFVQSDSIPMQPWRQGYCRDQA
jgi:hypothetical protein